MTLIISGCSAVDAFQASDRLLSRGTRPFDPESNKTIVLSLADAVVSLSYTGPAYVTHIPTDQWLVQHMIRAELGAAFDGSIANRLGRNHLASNSKIGVVLADLGAAIEAAHCAGQSHPLRIIATGFQSMKRRWRVWRPVMYVLEKTSAHVRPWISASPRFFGRSWCLDHSPRGYVLLEEIEGLMREDPGFTHPDQWINRVTDTMRCVAGRHSAYIGRDLMYVRIPPPPHRVVFVNFLEDPDRSETVQLDQRPAIFSPWIVDGWHIIAPSRAVGFSSIRLHNCLVRLSTPSNPLFGALYGQIRPRDPYDRKRN